MKYLFVFLSLFVSPAAFGASYGACRIFNGGSTPLNTLHVFHYGGGSPCSGSQDDLGFSPTTVNPGQFSIGQVPVAFSGTGETGSANGYDTNGISYCTGNIVWTWPVNGSGYYVDFYLYPIVTNNIFPASVTNNSGMPAQAYFKLNGNMMYTTPLSPGQVANYTYSWSGNGTLDYGYNVIQTGLTGDFTNGTVMLTNVVLGSSGVTQTNLNGFAGGPAPGGNGSTNFVFPIGSQISGSLAATNGPIRWDSTNTAAARDATLQAGFNQLHSDMQLAAQIAGSDLANDKTNGGGGGTVVVTNGFGEMYLSNMWATEQAAANGTNLLNNNFGDEGVHMSITNPAILLGKGSNILSSSGFSAALDGAVLANLPPTNETAISGMSDVDIPLGSIAGTPIVMHANIFSGMWGDVWDLMRNVARWLIIAFYMYRVVREVWEYISAIGSAQQMQFPKMQAGGFSIGLFLVPLIVGAFMTIYGTLLGAAAVNISGNGAMWSALHLNPYEAAPGSGPVREGVNALYRAFPVGLALGVFAAYITWRVSMNKVGTIVLAGVRAMAS